MISAECLSFIAKHGKYPKQKIKNAADAVDKLVIVKIRDNQRTALISLVVDVGAFAFRESELLQYVNMGDEYRNHAGRQFPKFGRSLRRKAERKLFCQPHLVSQRG